MANTAAPWGFRRWGAMGGAPNFMFASGQPIPGSTTAAGYRIAAGGSAIFFGDAVQMNPTGPSGFLIPWVNGAGTNTTSMLTGIFLGCEYYSTSQKKTIYNNYWPGSDATGDVRAYVLDDPLTILEVQAGVAATPFTDAMIGQTADIVNGSGTGNTTTGISTMSLATPTTTATLPFKVWGLVTSPLGANGTDITTAFNNVLVQFNNQMFKTLQGV
jgi:hypothetical protein